MARPQKQGLDYFPHDCDASSDEKIEVMRALHGNDGYAFYFIMLERIYRTPDGEVGVSDAETLQIFAKKCCVTAQKLQEMISTAVKYGLFDHAEYHSRQVLTSHGIKQRMGDVVTKRLAARLNYRGRISGAETHQETGPEMQPVKESKVKESKVTTPRPPKGGYESQQAFDQFWAVYPKKVDKPAARKAFAKLHPNDDLLATIKSAIVKQKEWPQWSKDGGQFVPNPATWLNGERWNDEPAVGGGNGNRPRIPVPDRVPSGGRYTRPEDLDRDEAETNG